MVSRRKILSRSRDELHSDIYFMNEDDDEDVWYSKEKLYRDHLQEVIEKWDSIDDEIWAKVIVLERNRRVAKAYARAPVITVNGSTDGFDGFRIGVAGFDNPLRDSNTSAAIQALGLGLKLKMDDVGNVLVKRITRGAAVSIKNTTEESAVSNDILKLPNGILNPDQPYKVFDMKKFQQNMSRELKRSSPDRLKLENQCISAIAFGNSDPEEDEGDNDNSTKTESDDPLRSPLWILVVNIVAMEMLRSKLPPGPSRYRAQSAPGPLSLMPASQMGIRPFGSGSSDEDPYSVAGSGSSGSSGNNNRGGSKGSSPPADRPPKLPPRDTTTSIYGASIWARPLESQLRLQNKNSTGANSSIGGGNGGHNSRKDGNNNKNKAKRSTGDDPYYCGLRARIPNFVKKKKKSSDTSMTSSKLSSKMTTSTTASASSLINMGTGVAGKQSGQPHPQHPQSHPFWWHSRLYSENPGQLGPGQFSLGPSGPPGPGDNHPRVHPMNSMMPYIPTDSSDSDYSHIYGRLPIPTRGIRKFPAKPLFLSHWE